jgi:hypothetical protein
MFYRFTIGMSPPRHKPFFAARGFFPSPPEPFELPVYVEPLARAFAEHSLDDVEMTEGVADTGISRFIDVEAAESSRTHSSNSSSRTSSSTHEDSCDDSS